MHVRLPTLAAATLIGALGTALLFGCADAPEGASRGDIEELMASAVADLSDQMLTPDEAERLVNAALDSRAERAAPMTLADVRQAVGEELEELMTQLSPSATAAAGDQAPVQAVAQKSAPAAYTQHFVEMAIDRYKADGRAATIDYYSRPYSIDDQWYVFMIDENDMVIAHPDANRVGLDLNGPVGTDVNGYVFGGEILTATEAGKWVPYVYANPSKGTLDDDGRFELKNAWVVRHDGILFASGWYIDTDEFAPALISAAAEHYRTGGLEAILDFYNDPVGLAAGMIPMAEYYNTTGALGGYFTGIIAADDGRILAHFDPELIGTNIEDLLGPGVRNATAAGRWITAEDNPADGDGPEAMRMWMVDEDGVLIGAGWYSR